MKRGTFIIDETDHALLAGLSYEHQRILLMTGTYKERAAELAVPLGTVRSRLNRARTALTKQRETVAKKQADPLAEKMREIAAKAP